MKKIYAVIALSAALCNSASFTMQNQNFDPKNPDVNIGADFRKAVVSLNDLAQKIEDSQNSAEIEKEFKEFDQRSDYTYVFRVLDALEKEDSVLLANSYALLNENVDWVKNWKNTNEHFTFELASTMKKELACTLEKIAQYLPKKARKTQAGKKVLRFSAMKNAHILLGYVIGNSFLSNVVDGLKYMPDASIFAPEDIAQLQQEYKKALTMLNEKLAQDASYEEKLAPLRAHLESVANAEVATAAANINDNKNNGNASGNGNGGNGNNNGGNSNNNSNNSSTNTGFIATITGPVKSHPVIATAAAVAGAGAVYYAVTKATEEADSE